MSETAESLILQVSAGDISPEEAEEMAQKIGLPPLAGAPKDFALDPRWAETWSLAMAAAWIVDRSFGSVQRLSDVYRAQKLVWVPEGHGHVLRPSEPAVTELMRGTRARGEMPETNWKNSSGYRGAIWSLWEALGDGALVATADGGSGTKEVPSNEWCELRWYAESGREYVAYRGARNEQIYRNARVAAADVLRLWPFPQLPPARLPEIVPPDGPGHMTLFHAALWIATRGGAFSFDPASDEIWAPAYKALTDRIAEGEVEVSGFRSGQRAYVPREVFVGIRVSFPSGSEGLWFETEPYLCSYLYRSEEAWNGVENDSIQGRKGPIWTKLLVAERDVRKHWPFGVLPPPGAGTPGRPSKSAHLIGQEFDRRASAGETALGLLSEAEALRKWLVRTHPELPPPTEKTIANNIRKKFRDVKKTRN